MKRLDSFLAARPAYVILMAVAAAAGSMLGHPVSFMLGALLALILLFLAMRSYWVGLLALFPLVVSIQPTPPSIGLQEAMFAFLTAIVVMKSLADGVVSIGWIGMGRRYGKPIVVASVLITANLIVAISHGVELVDWMCGLVPFLFIVIAIPIAQAIEDRPERLTWLGVSIGVTIILLAAYVLAYFMVHGLHQPYWVTLQDGVVKRITGDWAALHGGAGGPYFDRITVYVQSATDALLPVGVVAGLIVAASANSTRAVILGYVVSVLSLLAILATYTRSMLMSAMLIVGFFVFQQLRDGYRVARLVYQIMGLVLIGTVFVLSLGIESMWGARFEHIGQAVEQPAAVASVTTRLQEYQIAWDRFVEYPLFGNGLGAKHVIGFEENTPGHFVERRVAYIHNWPLYFLMAGGLIGFAFYAWMLLSPIWVDKRITANETLAVKIITASILTMAVYGLFFAVFRLITFNLLLAAIWGVTLAIRRSKKASVIPV